MKRKATADPGAPGLIKKEENEDFLNARDARVANAEKRQENFSH